MVMIAAMTVTFDGTRKDAIEVYQCWKNSALASATTAGLFGMSCHVFSAVTGASTGKAILVYALYDMKVPGTKITTGTDLGAKSDGSYLFYSKSAAGGTKKGFGDTALFTEKY